MLRKETLQNHVFVSRRTLVAGYYVFTLAVHVSVRLSDRPSVIRTSIRPHFVPFDNLSIYKRILFKVCICICTNSVSHGIVNVQNFDNLSQSYGTCQCTKKGFWHLVPLLFEPS